MYDTPVSGNVIANLRFTSLVLARFGATNNDTKWLYPDSESD